MQFRVPVDSPKRLDLALSALLPDRTRSFLAKLIGDGAVSIDGLVVTRKSHAVEAGQTIAVEIPEPEPLDVQSQDLPLTVIYQDSDLAVIEKPAGMVVHPAAGHADATLVNALLHHLGDLSGIGGVLRPGIVHRLDKDTSGLLVVAKTDAAHRSLTEAWGTDRVRKEYLALVYGTPKSDRGSIERPIGRDPRDRKKMAVVARGRPSVTLFEIVERFAHVSLLRVTLKTGRTHQIRVHLKSIGHPIVGDATYAGPQWRGIPDKRLQKVLAAMGRQALHAAVLSFPHPRTGEIMRFESELPGDFAGVVRAIRV